MDRSVEIRRYGKGDRNFVRAQQIWQILTGWVMWQAKAAGETTITYGDVAVKMGLSPLAGRTLAAPLFIISEYCSLGGLPRLNALVVNRNTAQPGKGIPHADTLDADQKAALEFDWYSIRPPTTGALRKAYDTEE